MIIRLNAINHEGLDEAQFLFEMKSLNEEIEYVIPKEIIEFIEALHNANKKFLSENNALISGISELYKAYHKIEGSEGAVSKFMLQQFFAQSINLRLASYRELYEQVSLLINRYELAAGLQSQEIDLATRTKILEKCRRDTQLGMTLAIVGFAIFFLDIFSLGFLSTLFLLIMLIGMKLIHDANLEERKLNAKLHNQLLYDK